jgi:iron-sulfur cluster assembly protein
MNWSEYDERLRGEADSVLSPQSSVLSPLKRRRSLVRRVYCGQLMTTLTLTNEAVTRLRSVLETQQAPDGALRVFVSPGGCSGFSYGMSLEAEPADDDEVVEQSGVKVVVDPFSLQYLSGAQIDFIDSLMGGGFTVVNPNAVKSCACGQSFDTTFGGGAAKPCH